MGKVQTGRVIEFYSNSCLVDINGQKLPCSILGKQDIVVGDNVVGVAVVYVCDGLCFLSQQNMSLLFLS